MFQRRGRNQCCAGNKHYPVVSMKQIEGHTFLRHMHFHRLFALALGLAAMVCAGCGSCDACPILVAGVSTARASQARRSK